MTNFIYLLDETCSNYVFHVLLCDSLWLTVVCISGTSGSLAVNTYIMSHSGS